LGVRDNGDRFRPVPIIQKAIIGVALETMRPFNVEQFEIVVHAGAAKTYGTPFFQVAVDFNGLFQAWGTDLKSAPRTTQIHNPSGFGAILR